MDTDTLVAAMRSPAGASAALLAAARAGRVTLVGTVSLCIEYEAVCGRPEHAAAAGISPSEARAFVDAIVALLDPAETWFMWRPQLDDPGDEMVLEAAVNGRATAIVTFNQRDFRPGAGRFGIEILQPSEVLRRIR